MIRFIDLELRRGHKQLLHQANATINPGEKVALVGSNGSGKTSLFTLMQGQLSPDQGELQLPGEWCIAHMAQEVASSDRSALDYVLDGDLTLRALEQQIRQAEADDKPMRQAELLEQLDAIDGYTAGNRAEQLLLGLGFGNDELHKPVNQFSGGWRIRLNLAQALMQRSDLLLLDEPTNHLDLDTELWLEQWLQQFSGTLILISHDRDFIDNVCDRVIHIEHQQLQTYRGNYSAFERQRSERLAQQQAVYVKQQRRINEIQQFVSRFRAKATKAKQAQSRLKELARMEAIAPAHIDSPFTFRFADPDKMSDPLLNLSQGQLGYAGKVVVDGVNLSIHPGQRIGLLGRNGAGKSTLIKTLVGDIPLLAGHISAGEHLRIGYFSQHQLEALDLKASPVLHLQRLSPTASEQQIRDFLGSFNFLGDQALAPIMPFSGGEKARLALAIIVWQRPNLLLLDEPTNHLDLEMCHALTMALQDFAGALVVISHDRHLLNSTVDQLFWVNAGSLTAFDGSLQDYSLLLQKRGDISGNSHSPAGDRTPDRKQRRQQAAAQRQQLAPLTRRANQLEQQLQQCEQQLAALESTLADPELYQPEAKQQLQALLQQQGQLRNDREALETGWLTLQEEIEQLSAGIN